MDDRKTPASGDQPETKGSVSKYESNITQSLHPKINTPVLLRVGGPTWEETPDGEYYACCTKVDPEFGVGIYRKLVLYFTITEGAHTGKRARLFYNKLSIDEAKENGTDFGTYSKFYSDLKKMFPEVIGDGSNPIEIDPVKLFKDENFIITTELRGKKKQATVQGIKYDPGF